MRSFLTRFYKDQRGAHVVEMSLAVGLFALVAAFGYFAFADSLADYYDILGNEFGNASLFIDSAEPVD